MTRLSLSMVKIERAEDVATISIQRPDELNGVNPAVLHQMQRALDDVVDDPSVRAVVIGGQGRAFVVGADLGFFLRNIESGDMKRIVQFTLAGHRLMNAIDECPKRVVACVGGVALGAGVELALACDFVVASPRSSFGLPETGLGIYPAFGGTQRTPRRIGVGLAKWLIFTGKTLSASEARKIGLIDQVVPHEQLDHAARSIARDESSRDEVAEANSPELDAIGQFFALNRADELRAGRADSRNNPILSRAMKMVAAKGPLALRIAERLIEEGSRQTLAAGLQMEIDHVVEILGSEDAYRGLSFRARRQVGRPEFVGR
ncbi:MAG: enoyl-CoA hydratase/isomerase family protein [Pirellulaceae bacterium]|nr:enoyl-CoA hydratase/isomerase family protein [Pirellulaceae bacterium]